MKKPIVLLALIFRKIDSFQSFKKWSYQAQCFHQPTLILSLKEYLSYRYIKEALQENS